MFPTPLGRGALSHSPPCLQPAEPALEGLWDSRLEFCSALVGMSSECLQAVGMSSECPWATAEG